MTIWAVIGIIVGIVAIVFGVIYALLPYLIKRGVNVLGIITTTQKVLKVSDTVIDTVGELMPGIGAVSVVDKIIEWAQRGVDAAEQMYLSSQLGADERKAKATEIVYAALHAVGVQFEDADMKIVIDGAIEAAVKGLAKTGVNE